MTIDTVTAEFVDQPESACIVAATTSAVVALGLELTDEALGVRCGEIEIVHEHLPSQDRREDGR